MAGVLLLAATSCAAPGAGSLPAATSAAAPALATATPQAAADQPAATLPGARFAHPDYYAMPGQEITFDVSASLPRGVSIAQYEWDFDADGVIDEAGPLAVTKHSYDAVFEGTATVRITHLTGGSSTASAGVHIGRGPWSGLPAAPVNVKVAVTAHAAGISTVQISWEPGGAEPYRWGLTVDGFPAGVVAGKERTATITDVHRVRAVEVGVVGFTENMGMGERAGVTLPALPG